MSDLIFKRRGGALHLAAVGVKDIDTKSGNPWHDPRTGRFANAPPGVKLLRGLKTLSETSGQTKSFIEKRRKLTSPDSMAAAPVGPNVRILFFREGQLVDDFTVAKDVSKVGKPSKPTKVAKPAKPAKDESLVDGDVVDNIESALNTLYPQSVSQDRADDDVGTVPLVKKHVFVRTEGEELKRMLADHPGSFLNVAHPDSHSGWKLHIFGADLDTIVDRWMKVRHLVNEREMGAKLGTAHFLEKMAVGHRQHGKGVTIYLPRRDTAQADAQAIIDALGAIDGEIKGDEMLAPGIGARFEFAYDPGYDVTDNREMHRLYAPAGDKPRPEGVEPLLSGGGMAFPKRITKRWMETEIPKLDAEQAKKLIARLKSSGWKDVPGSLPDRVYPHLAEDVRGALGIELPKKGEVDKPGKAPEKVVEDIGEAIIAASFDKDGKVIGALQKLVKYSGAPGRQLSGGYIKEIVRAVAQEHGDRFTAVQKLAIRTRYRVLGNATWGGDVMFRKEHLDSLHAWMQQNSVVMRPDALDALRTIVHEALHLSTPMEVKLQRTEAFFSDLGNAHARDKMLEEGLVESISRVRAAELAEQLGVEGIEKFVSGMNTRSSLEELWSGHPPDDMFGGRGSYQSYVDWLNAAYWTPMENALMRKHEISRKDARKIAARVAHDALKTHGDAVKRVLYLDGALKEAGALGIDITVEPDGWRILRDVPEIEQMRKDRRAVQPLYRQQLELLRTIASRKDVMATMSGPLRNEHERAVAKLQAELDDMQNKLREAGIEADEGALTPEQQELLREKWDEPPKPRGIHAGRGGAGGYTSEKAESTLTQLGQEGEALFVKLTGGKLLHPEGKGEQSPLDVHFDGLGFEVKTVSADATSFKATPKKHEIASKEAHAAELGVEPALAIVVIDRESGVAKAYMRRGLNGGRLLRNTGWTHMGDVPLTDMSDDDARSDSITEQIRQLDIGAMAVGGAVRDQLMGGDPKDVDFLVPGKDADEIKALLEPHGRVEDLIVAERLVGVRFWPADGSVPEGVEIVPPRREISTGEGHQDFEIVPDASMSVEEDMERRDFTINAMARDLETGELIDPYGGEQDLRDKVLRAVSPTSFRDDPLRIVRGLRFVARYDLEPDEDTLEQMREYAAGVANVSGERIRMELDKLLMSPHPAKALRLARDTGALEHMLPELAATVGFFQESQYHDLTLDEHIFAVVQAAADNGAPLPVRIAALYHDVGKPESAWRGPSGRLHYYANPELGKRAHEDIGAEMAERAMGQSGLAYPAEVARQVSQIIRGHMEQSKSTPVQARRFIAERGRDIALDILQHKRADVMGKGVPDEETLAKLDEWEALVKQEMNQPLFVKDLEIDGRDLIELGVEPGPLMGEILRQLLADVIGTPSNNTPEWLKNRAAGIIKKAGRKARGRSDSDERAPWTEETAKLASSSVQTAIGYAYARPEVWIDDGDSPAIVVKNTLGGVAKKPAGYDESLTEYVREKLAHTARLFRDEGLGEFVENVKVYREEPPPGARPGEDIELNTVRSWLSHYTNTLAGSINRNLRSGVTATANSPEIGLLESYMAPLPEGTTVYRGVGSHVLEMLSGEKPSRDPAELVEQVQRALGGTIVDPALMSTSKQQSVGSAFAKGAGSILFEIDAGGQRGLDVGEFGGRRDESEVIFARDSLWEVESVEAEMVESGLARNIFPRAVVKLRSLSMSDDDEGREKATSMPPAPEARNVNHNFYERLYRDEGLLVPPRGEAIEQWAAYRGMTPDEYEAEIANMAREWLHPDRVKVSARAPVSVLERILDEGRMKSQHETGTSKGHLDPGYRLNAEAVFFGRDPELTRLNNEWYALSERERLDRQSEFRMAIRKREAELMQDSEFVRSAPIYGYVGSTEEDMSLADVGTATGEPYDRTLDQYGKARIVFKDAVRSRTTFTSTDSLDITGGGRAPNLAPAPIDDPTHHAFVMGKAPEVPFEEFEKHLSTAGTRFGRDPIALMQQKTVDEVDYVEVQIHDGVTVDDIERVVFSGSAPKAVREKLEAAGIVVEVQKRSEARKAQERVWHGSELAKARENLAYLESGDFEFTPGSRGFATGKWTFPNGEAVYGQSIERARALLEKNIDEHAKKLKRAGGDPEAPFVPDVPPEWADVVEQPSQPAVRPTLVKGQTVTVPGRGEGVVTGFARDGSVYVRFAKGAGKFDLGDVGSDKDERPELELFGTKFERSRAFAGRTYLVRLSGDLFGLYAAGGTFRNEHGTPLIAKGTLEELIALRSGEDEIKLR